MSEAEPESTESKPGSEKQKTGVFYNKHGFGTNILRIKDEETIEQAIERLRKAGWEIPDLNRLIQGSDAGGKMFQLKA